MEFLRRGRGGGEEVRFDFTVHVKELGPWPPGKKVLAIGWQRGSKRKGSTRFQEPVQKRGQLHTTYPFNETFHVPATLYRDAPASADNNLAAGSFRKKCLVLAVLETDGRTKATAMLGRVVINLAEYAGYDVEEFLSFPVACHRAIVAAVGQPNLRLDLVCRWRNKQPGPRASSVSGASSISTDTTNSTLSSNLSAFLQPARPSSVFSASKAERLQQQLADLDAFDESREELPQRANGNGNGQAGLEPDAQGPGPSRIPRVPSRRPRPVPKQRETAAAATTLAAATSAAAATSGGPAGEASPRQELHAATSSPKRRSNPGSSVPGLESIAEAEIGASPEPAGLAGAAAAGGEPAGSMGVDSRAKSKMDKVSQWLNSPDFDPTRRAGSGFSANSDGHGASKDEQGALASPQGPESPDGADSSQKRNSGLEGPGASSKARRRSSMLRPRDSGAPDGTNPFLDAPGTKEEEGGDRPFGQAATEAKARGGHLLNGDTLEIHSQIPCAPQRRVNPFEDAEISSPATPRSNPFLSPSESTVSHSTLAAQSQPNSGAVPIVGLGAVKAHDGPAANPFGEPPGGARSPERGAQIQIPFSSLTPERPGEGGPLQAREPGPQASTIRRREAPAPISTDDPGPFESGIAVSSATAWPSASSGPLMSPSADSPFAPSAHSASPFAASPLPLAQRGAVSPGLRHRSEGLADQLVVDAGVEWQGAMDRAVMELQMLAATESAIYWARHTGSGAGCSLRSRSTRSHEPARRLARTVACLGPLSGRAFGKRAVQSIRAVADGMGEDTAGLVFWWGNCLALRTMLSSDRFHSSSNDKSQKRPWLHTVTELCVSVAALERHLFDRALQTVWWQVLVPSVASSEAHARRAQAAQCGKKGRSRDTAAMGRVENVATHRWLDAFDAVRSKLCPAHEISKVGGHMRLLACQVLAMSMRRVDLMLFSCLLMGGVDGTLPKPVQDSDPGPYNEVTILFPNLDEAALPFSEGPLSFGTGMHIKMAVGKWEAWAIEAGISSEIAAPYLSSNSTSLDLFPHLRSAADLLMLPKNSLDDEDTRQEIFPALDLPHIVALLERFEPDEYSPDPLPTNLLQNLRQQVPAHTPVAQPTSAGSSKTRRHGSIGNISSVLSGPDGYPESNPKLQRCSSLNGVLQAEQPAVDRDLALRFWAHHPVEELPGLDMDADSEDELDILAKEVCQRQPDPLKGGAGAGWQRFALLKTLWRDNTPAGTHVPRSSSASKQGSLRASYTAIGRR